MNHDEAFATLPPSLASQAAAFFSAAEDLHRRASGGSSEGTSDRGQTGTLTCWARDNGFLIDPTTFETDSLVSNCTSEHEVRYRSSQNRAWKRTWAGFYGQVPCPDKGKLGRRNATPAEYMRRMELQVSIFFSDIKLEGVSVSDKPSMIIGQPDGEPSILISQEWLEKTMPAKTEAIAVELREFGFVPVPDSYFGWYRESDRVAIVDAKPDNFIATAAGIIALDLQMAVFSSAEAAEAGLPCTAEPLQDPGTS